MPAPSLSHPWLQVTLTLALLLAPQSIEAPGAVDTRSQSPLERTWPPAIDAGVEKSAPLPETTSPLPQPASTQQQPAIALPRVALIIDDMGYNREIGRQLLELHLPLSFSFLPHAPHSAELAQLAWDRGRTILVHLPMEPKAQQWKEEPVTLRVGEKEARLRKKTEQMLQAIPTAMGANNHMGSRFTEHRQEMRQVLSTLKEHGLFFIDSYTSSGSVAETTARQLNIPTARRRVFLDNEQRHEAICRQMKEVADLAAREGQAIAIGHPNQAMVAAFASCARHNLAGVTLVGVEQLLSSPVSTKVLSSAFQSQAPEN